VEPTQQSSNEPAKADNANDILKALSDDSLDETEKPKEDLLGDDSIDEKEKQEEQEDEVILEDDEPNEEQLSLETPPARKEILAAYPELFKKFPYLEKAYYREQKYTELFPTIEHAKEAIEAQENYKKFEDDLLKGDVSSVLKSIKDNDEKAFNKLVDDYLPNLAKIDKNAYYHLLGNITRSTIHAMIRSAKSEGNEDLEAAATILNKFVFGNSEYQPPSRYSKEPLENPEADKLKQERESLFKERLENVVNDLQSRADNSIRSTISIHIDPKNQIPEYVKKIAIKQVEDNLASLLEKDERFAIVKNNLWKKAIESKLNKNSIDAILSAYRSKARTLLPSLITKARNEALKGIGRRNEPDNTKEKEDKRGPLPVGKAASPRSSHSQQSNDTQSKTRKRTIDYLSED